MRGEEQTKGTQVKIKTWKQMRERTRKDRERKEEGERNLQQTLTIQKKIGRLHIAMNDGASVHEIDRFEKLIDDEAFVNVFEDVRADDSVKIGF